MRRARWRAAPDAPDHSKPTTVDDALARYARDLRTRGADPANAQRVRKHLTATLATKPVMLLSVQDLRHWRDGLVSKGVGTSDDQQDEGRAPRCVGTGGDARPPHYQSRGVPRRSQGPAR